MHLNEIKWLNRVNIQLLLIYINNSINSKHHRNGIHDNIGSITDMHLKIEFKHMHILIFETVLTPPTMCRPYINLPALDLTAHHAQQWVTPEMGLSSTQGKGILG
jgi:hypothetical protein